MKSEAYLTKRLVNLFLVTGELGTFCHEEDARKAYCAKMKLGQPVEVESAGLVLHTKYSYLGASPDGVVFDASAHPRFGLLEVKCPNRAFSLGLTVREACRSLPLFCCELVNENVQLKRTHEYFFQIQGQTATCKSAWCDFVVWVT